jgi:hypothetical protein
MPGQLRTAASRWRGRQATRRRRPALGGARWRRSQSVIAAIRDAWSTPGARRSTVRRDRAPRRETDGVRSAKDDRPRLTGWKPAKRAKFIAAHIKESRPGRRPRTPPYSQPQGDQAAMTKVRRWARSSQVGLDRDEQEARKVGTSETTSSPSTGLHAAYERRRTSRTRSDRQPVADQFKAAVTPAPAKTRVRFRRRRLATVTLDRTHA